MGDGRGEAGVGEVFALLNFVVEGGLGEVGEYGSGEGVEGEGVVDLFPVIRHPEHRMRSSDRLFN